VNSHPAVLSGWYTEKDAISETLSQMVRESLEEITKEEFCIVFLYFNFITFFSKTNIMSITLFLSKKIQTLCT